MYRDSRTCGELRGVIKMKGIGEGAMVREKARTTREQF